MEFQVPQFIDMENKVFGPFSLRQFLYLVGGGAGMFICYQFLGVYVGAIPIVAIGALAWALAFLKINNRPFINYMESAVRYWLGGKLYIWHKEPNQAPALTPKPIAERPIGVSLPRLSDSKLDDLAWSLDIKDKMKQ